MIGRGRQIFLLLLSAFLPAFLLVITLWGYNIVVQGIRKNLLEQRKLGLQNMQFPLEDSVSRSYAVALLSSDSSRILYQSPDWPYLDLLVCHLAC